LSTPAPRTLARERADLEHEARSRADQPVSLTLTPRTVGIALGVGVAGLVVAGVIAALFEHAMPDFPFRDTYVELFDLNKELSVPTWYAASLLLTASAILALITLAVWRLRLPFRWHWAALTVGFVGLSMDEAAAIHDQLGKAGSSVTAGSDLSNVSWVVPAALIVLLLAAAFVPFLAHLPRRTAASFLGAGLVYVGGALGLEVAGAVLEREFTLDSLTGSLVLAIEETTEMVGAVLFIVALLVYVRDNLAGWRVSAGSSPAGEAGSAR